MVDWQITATTILCNEVGDEVTLLVHKDFTAECTGYAKYSGKEASSVLKKRGSKLGRRLACVGEACRRLAEYREKLLAEESTVSSSGKQSPAGGLS